MEEHDPPNAVNVPLLWFEVRSYQVAALPEAAEQPELLLYGAAPSACEASRFNRSPLATIGEDVGEGVGVGVGVGVGEGEAVDEGEGEGEAVGEMDGSDVGGVSDSRNLHPVMEIPEDTTKSMIQCERVFIPDDVLWGGI